MYHSHELLKTLFQTAGQTNEYGPESKGDEQPDTHRHLSQEPLAASGTDSYYDHETITSELGQAKTAKPKNPSPSGRVESVGGNTSDPNSCDGATTKFSMRQERGVESSDLTNSKSESDEDATGSQGRADPDQTFAKEKIDSLAAGANNADSQLEGAMNLPHGQRYLVPKGEVQPVTHQPDFYIPQGTVTSPCPAPCPADTDATLAKEIVDPIADELNPQVEIGNPALGQSEDCPEDCPENCPDCPEKSTDSQNLGSINDLEPLTHDSDSSLAEESMRSLSPDAPPVGDVGGSDDSSLYSMDLMEEETTLDGGQVDSRTSRPVESRYY